MATLIVKKVAFRFSGGLKSSGKLMRRVDKAWVKDSGTGTTCISPSSPSSGGTGILAARHSERRGATLLENPAPLQAVHHIFLRLLLQ